MVWTCKKGKARGWFKNGGGDECSGGYAGGKTEKNLKGYSGERYERLRY